MCSFFFNGCNSKPDKTVTVIKDGNTTSYEIHIQEVKDSTSFKLSDLAKDFEFIPLETSEQSLVERGKYMITEKYILVQKPAHGISQFDRHGKFLRTLVRRGGGPTEYQRIGWAVDEATQILYIADIQKNNYLLRFDLESGAYKGDLKKAIPIRGSELLISEANKLLIIPSGAFNEGLEPFYYYEQDMQGELINRCAAPEDWFNRFVENTGLKFGNNIWYQNRKTEILSKVLENQLFPFLVFDYGKKLPESGSVGDMSFGLDFEINDIIFFHIFTVTGTEQRDNSFISYGENTNYLFDPKNGKVTYSNLLYLNPTHHYVDAHEREFVVQGNGLLFYIYSAIDLIEQAKKASEDDDFTEPFRTKLIEISDKISEASNPVLLLGRIK